MRNIRQHKTYSELLCYTKKNSCVTAHLTLRKGLLNMKNIMILDGHSLAFRAYHALPVLNAPDGTPTNVIAGFMNMLSRLENDVRPDCIAAVFDAPGPTFRHELYLDYKAQRKPTPEDFLYAPGNKPLTGSLDTMEKYANNLHKDLGVATSPVEVTPGQWRLRVDQMPPLTPLPELKR